MCRLKVSIYFIVILRAEFFFREFRKAALTVRRVLESLAMRSLGLFWAACGGDRRRLGLMEAMCCPRGGGLLDRLLHACRVGLTHEIALAGELRPMAKDVISRRAVASGDELFQNSEHGFQIDRISGQLLDLLDGGNDAVVATAVLDAHARMTT